jgi:hypothetical protein
VTSLRPRLLLAAAAVVPLLALAACGPPAPEGLSAEQCEEFVPLTEEYLFVYLDHDWKFAADNPSSALSAVQRVAGDIAEAADDHASPQTADAVHRVREAYGAVVRLADTYLDEPLVVGDPAAVAAQEAVLDEVVAALADCGEIDRDWPANS